MIQRPGLTFTLCITALLLGTTALAAQGPGDLAAQLAMPIASNLAGARDVPRFAWIENAAGARNVWVGGPAMVAPALTSNTEDAGVELSDVAGGETRTVWTAPDGVGGRYYGTRSRNLFWSADDKLVFPSEASGWVHAWTVDVKGGAARDLTPGNFEVEAFLLGAVGRSIIYAANADNLDSRHLWRRPRDGGCRDCRHW